MASANRVEEDDVLGIFVPDDSGLDLDPFISASHALVEDKLTDSHIGHGETLLFEIEKWLAAHFAAVACRQPVSEEIGVAAINYGTKLGLGLDNTIYGQQAKLLDTSGTLARLDGAGEPSGGGQARFRVIDPAWDGS